MKMIVFKRFIFMLQFFTTIPLPFNINVDEKDLGKGLAFAPLVGLIIGSLLAGFYYLVAPYFTQGIMAAFIILLYFLLTGGLHMDGLGDTFDGIFSCRPKAKMLEIMRDSRIGTFALLAVLGTVLVNWAILSEMTYENSLYTLILMPMAGRIGSLVGAGISTYARTEQGLGKSFIEYCGFLEIIIGSISYGIVFYLVAGMDIMLPAIIPLISGFLIVKYLSRKVGGATGDILGAVCELNQTVFLIVMYLWR